MYLTTLQFDQRCQKFYKTGPGFAQKFEFTIDKKVWFGQKLETFLVSKTFFQMFFLFLLIKKEFYLFPSFYNFLHNRNSKALSVNLSADGSAYPD